jgi:hypothetical protein
MPVEPPEPVATYLAAVNTKNAEIFDLCFADDARVRDEGRDYRGLGAIKAWKRDTETKYRYLIEPLDVKVSGETVKLHALLTGDFPGSPVELDYTFTLANGKITSLEIQ